METPMASNNFNQDQFDASFDQKNERELRIYCAVKCNVCADGVQQKTTTVLSTCENCSNILFPPQVKYHLSSQEKDVVLDGTITRNESIRKLSVSSNEK